MMLVYIFFLFFLLIFVGLYIIFFYNRIAKIFTICKTINVTGKNSIKNGTVLKRFSTAPVLEELIVPPVQISYTLNLIDGNFVDAASGNL